MIEILNAAVSHKKFGNGKIAKIEAGYVTILFNDFEKKFTYPDSFRNFLNLSDYDLSEKIRVVIEETELQQQELKRIEKEKCIEKLRQKEIQDQLEKDEETAKKKLIKTKPGKELEGRVGKISMLDNKQMASLFHRVKETLFSNSRYTKQSLTSALMSIKITKTE